ncbi:MAG TPA: cytochrome c [Pirellulales bacterium]|nr:cytochrome c [Pirellulales bacterium]
MNLPAPLATIAAPSIRLRPSLRRPLLAVCLAMACAGAAGCDMLDMYDQPRYEPLEASEVFDDHGASRQLVQGTVPRGWLREDDALYTGKINGEFVSELPVEFNEKLMKRGQQRFNIYCSVCHSRTGDGDGMIVRRGFRRPPSLHIDRLRNAPAGHFFDVMTHGFGAMPSYASRIKVADRWAIVAYIRALQLSQNARLQDVPEDERPKLDKPQEQAEAPAAAETEQQEAGE